MNLHVLVADQDVELANMYCRFLDDHGYTAASAESASECLARIRRQAPGVLVLDSELGWGDAKEVLAGLREDGLALPVILTTWRAPPVNSSRRVTPPVVLRLQKLFPLSALLDGVQQALGTAIVDTDAIPFPEFVAKCATMPRRLRPSHFETCQR